MGPATSSDQYVRIATPPTTTLTTAQRSEAGSGLQDGGIRQLSLMSRPAPAVVRRNRPASAETLTCGPRSPWLMALSWPASASDLGYGITGRLLALVRRATATGPAVEVKPTPGTTAWRSLRDRFGDQDKRDPWRSREAGTDESARRGGQEGQRRSKTPSRSGADVRQHDRGAGKTARLQTGFSR